MRPAVVLTQADRRARRLAATLGSAGFDCACWPMIALEPDDAAALDAALSALDRFDVAVLPSPGAIEVVFERLQGRAWPATTPIAVIGPGSRESLELALGGAAAGSKPEIWMPAREPHDADALLRLPAMQQPKGRRVLVLHRADGRADWIETLRARGAQLECVAAYRAQPLAPPPEAAAWLAAARDAGRELAFVVGSVDVATRLTQWLRALAVGLSAWVLARPVLAVHPRIVAHLAALGWERPRLHGAGEASLRRGLESLTDD